MRCCPGPIKEASKVNKPAANTVLSELNLQRRLEFPPLLVFAVASMKLLCVKNSVVGNAI
jgi:hypothetical protein